MPPERLNGGAIRGSLPTGRHDSVGEGLSALYGRRDAPPADAGRLSDKRAVEGASPYEAQGDSVGAALPPLQGEVAASLRADGGVRRPPTPDRLTEDGRLIAAPTEPGNPPSALPPAPDLRAHFDALWAASERLAAEFDDFDPAAALHDPDFLRLTAPGLGVEPRRAWLALHPESLQRRTAAALGLSRAEQQRLKERIHRAAALGEKIYP